MNNKMNNKKNSSPTIVSSHDVHLDSDYIQWIHDIKERFLSCDSFRYHAATIF